MLTDDAEEITQRLSVSARSQLIFARPCGDSEASEGWHLVRLPIDGPIDALRVAVSGLRHWLGQDGPRTAIVAEATDGPPAPRVLAAIAQGGLTPAVDLDRCAWITGEGVWLPGAAGTAFLRVDWHDADSVRQAWTLAASVLPLGQQVSPKLWSHARPAGDPPGLEHWRQALQAAYLELASAV